ncbi:hypothetical protein L1787_24100 [Acuticoccus sp. M5D2P5]|uniref:hypothetical protein n=1 Tax=Acuticoccus kalidii TaxID=2910977 RepID=UPI001F4249FE|nr:hypothetical protein [Acuticoccus kalidii]MCF3936478.1 hypothetical protein [Acuticoccus kalidii]
MLHKGLFGAMALAGTLIVTSASAATYEYDTVFADSETISIDAQVAGTYPARSEVLVKMPNNNQYAVPVGEGADLSIWRENELVTVSITQGLIIEVTDTEAADPGYTYVLVDDTSDFDGIPDNVLVRQLTVTTTIKSVDMETGYVTFLAPSGDERRGLYADPDTLRALDVEKGSLFELTYFDAIDIEQR